MRRRWKGKTNRNGQRAGADRPPGKQQRFCDHFQNRTHPEQVVKSGKNRDGISEEKIFGFSAGFWLYPGGYFRKSPKILRKIFIKNL